MLTKDQITKIKKAEENFLQKVDELKNEYRLGIRSIIHEYESKKIEKIRKELKS